MPRPQSSFDNAGLRSAEFVSRFGDAPVVWSFQAVPLSTESGAGGSYYDPVVYERIRGGDASLNNYFRTYQDITRRTQRQMYWNASTGTGNYNIGMRDYNNDRYSVMAKKLKHLKKSEKSTKTIMMGLGAIGLLVFLSK